MMLSQGGPAKVDVATRPVDFRGGIDGLALAVQEMLGLDPFCGAVFVFRAASIRRRLRSGGLAEPWRLPIPG